MPSIAAQTVISGSVLPPIISIIIRQVKTAICSRSWSGATVRSVIPFIRNWVIRKSQICYSAHESIPAVLLGSNRIGGAVCFLKSLRVVPHPVIAGGIIPNESWVVISCRRKRRSAQEQIYCQHSKKPKPNTAHSLILIN